MVNFVLLPGMEGAGELLAHFGNALPKGSQILTIRFPGDQQSSFTYLTPRVQSKCSNLDNFILLAESFSTPIAIHLAASSPANLKGLILCAGFAESPLHGWRHSLAGFLAPWLCRFPLPEWVTRSHLLDPAAPAHLVKEVRDAVASVRPGVLEARIRAVLACDVRADLARITAPILHLQAKQDRLLKPECLDLILRHNPRVSAAAIDGPHLLLQRQPQAAVEAILAFIERDCQVDGR